MMKLPLFLVHVRQEKQKDERETDRIRRDGWLRQGHTGKAAVQAPGPGGIAYREIDYPRYGNPFAEPAKRYLEGELGKKPGDVNAYAASVLFSVDRYASYKQDWGGFYEAGGLVIANRYTTSNAVHQASKLPVGEQKEFLDWLFDLEYNRLGLPRRIGSCILICPPRFPSECSVGASWRQVRQPTSTSRTSYI